MTFRFPGLVPAFALLAPALAVAGMGAAHAQSGPAGQTGSMAYPQSLPSGQVQITAPTTRDTGNMAYPASPGGVTEGAPMGRDTGNMASPTGRANLGSRNSMAAASPMRGNMPAGSPPMRPDVAPTAAQTAAAQSLSAGPSAAPIPYTDFSTPAPAGRKGMMTRKSMHHAMPRKATAKPATPAAAPATPPATAK